MQVVITDIPVRRPGKQEFFRVNSLEGSQMDVGLLEFQVDRQFYVVAPEIGTPHNDRPTARDWAAS